MQLSGIWGLEVFAWVSGILGVPLSLGGALGLGFGFFCNLEVSVVGVSSAVGDVWWLCDLGSSWADIKAN